MITPLSLFFCATIVAHFAHAYDQVIGFDSAKAIENRTIDEIYAAAIAEGGVVTVWHGGDAPNQEDSLKKAFETRFPGVVMNLTVDFSKYQSARLDRDLAANNVYVDTIISQSLHDFPRWSDEGALLKYEPLGFDHVIPAYRDPGAAYYAIRIPFWTILWNSNKTGTTIKEFDDFLRPELKNRLVLTYPDDDDAVLFTFNAILAEYGEAWFEKLLKQNPRWVRGTQTPFDLIKQVNNTYAATFTSPVGVTPPTPFKLSFPTRGQFLSWDLQTAILKDAPHPEGAKLLSTFLLSAEYQKKLTNWPTRDDVEVPNQPFDVRDQNNTDPTALGRFLADRARVERIRTWFEDKIGPAQGSSPLAGGIY